MPANKSKRILSNADKQRIKKTLSESPQQALNDLRATVAVKTALQTNAAIDGIGNHPNRRNPLRQVVSLDNEFRSQTDRDAMIQTVRDLILNSSLIRGMIQTHVNNVVGNGPRLQMRSGDNKYDERAEAYFSKFAYQADLNEMLDFGRMVRIGYWDEIRDGDSGMIFWPYGMGKLQGVTGDLIADPRRNEKQESKQYTFGVESNKKGTPLAYHVWPSPPHGRRGRQGKPTRIKKEDFIFLFDPESYGQKRGISKFVSAITDAQDAREILEAVKGSVKLENWMGIFLKKHPAEGVESNPWGGTDTYTAGNNGGDVRREFRIAPGINVNELMPDEDVTALKKETPHKELQEFLLLIARFIGLALGMPLEIALQFYSRGSYATLKGAIRQYHGVIERERQNLRYQACNPIAWRVLERGHRLWIESGGKEGLQPPEPQDEHGKLTNHRRNYWQWPALNFLEPEKQLKSDAGYYALGRDTLDDIALSVNKDWEAQYKQRAKEIKRLIEIANNEEIDPRFLIPHSSLDAIITAPVANDEPENDGENNR